MNKNLKNVLVKGVLILLVAVVLSIVKFDSAFAAEKVRINNTTLNFNKVIYVDANKGDDVSGDGSEIKPFKSLWKCLNYLNDNKLRTDVSIVMNDGDYDWTSISSGFSYNVNSKFNGMKVSFIAKNPGKAFIYDTKGLELLITDHSPSQRIKFIYYGIIFHNITGGDGCGACLGGDDWTNEFYNCVFEKILVGGWNGAIANSSIKTVNCLFNQCKAGLYKTLPLSGQSINSASTNDIIDPYKGTKTTCLTNVNIDVDYNITSDNWKSKGTGTNPDKTQSNIGVYGGEFAWGKWKEPYILNIEPEKTKINLNNTVSANLTIDNIQDIAAEDIRIKYDSTKLKFLGYEEVEGIKLVKDVSKDGELRIILASKGKSNIINAKKALLKLKFKGTAVGDALVDVTKGRVSDGITKEYDLTDEQCGQATITIQKLEDVDNSGEYTLLDLAIDARHEAEDPSTLPQYNTDQDGNKAIDDADLTQIGQEILDNPNYACNNQA